MTNGPSYKQAMIVNYDSSVVVTRKLVALITNLESQFTKFTIVEQL